MPGIVNTDSSTTCNVGAGPPTQQRGVSSGHTTLDKTQHSSNSSLTQPIQLQHPTQPQYTSHSKQHPTDSLIISYSYFVYSCNRRRALYLPAALETATVTIGAARCGAVRCGARNLRKTARPRWRRCESESEYPARARNDGDSGRVHLLALAAQARTKRCHR